MNISNASHVKICETRLKIYRGIFRTKILPTALKNRLNTYLEGFQYKIHVNRLLILKKKFPIIGKGHNWCDLTQGAVRKLVELEKEIKKFTRFTQCSDEMYKQIVLLNQPQDIVGPISQVDIRFIDWSDHGKHPRTLTTSDRNTLCGISHLRSRYLYARKFDEKIDCQIIDEVFNNVMGSSVLELDLSNS